MQLQSMDARLDTLSTELYQVNVYVGRIEATPSPPSPMASDSEDDDDDDGDDDDDNASDDANGDASSTDEMST